MSKIGKGYRIVEKVEIPPHYEAPPLMHAAKPWFIENVLPNYKEANRRLLSSACARLRQMIDEHPNALISMTIEQDLACFAYKIVVDAIEEVEQ